MRVEGGWVGSAHAVGGGPRHRPISFSPMYRRGPPTQSAAMTLGRSRGAEARRVLRCGYGSYCFLRRNLPTSRLAASLGFACA